MKRKAGWLIVFFLLLLAECTLTDAASAAAINNSRNAASARKPPPAPKRLEHQAAQHDTHMAATPLVTLGYLILLRLCPGTVFPLVGSLYLKMALAAACTTAELPWGRIMCKDDRTPLADALISRAVLAPFRVFCMVCLAALVHERVFLDHGSLSSGRVVDASILLLLATQFLSSLGFMNLRF